MFVEIVVEMGNVEEGVMVEIFDLFCDGKSLFGVKGGNSDEF